MNGFLKFFKKHKIKGRNNINPCPNPPKKTIIKTKPLLAKNSKKIIQRNFGRDIQNCGHLTEENHFLINNKKRNREKIHSISINLKHEQKPKKIIISKVSKKFNKEKNKIFKVIHLSHNKINNDINIHSNTISCIEEEEEIQNENINPNKNHELIVRKQLITVCQNNERKEEIKIVNEQILINKNNNNKNENNNDIKEIKEIKEIKKIKVIKKSSHIKNKENSIKNKNNEINEKKESSRELKKIKVCIIGNKNISPRKNIQIFNKRLDLQSAKEYLNEIYIYLKSIENNALPLGNYMTIRQTDINEKMRIILINWIIEVHFKFHLLSETLFICINIIDRYLSKKDINRKYLQLLGVTSLFIACKYEEIYAPSSKDLIFMTDNAYKIEEMIKMESDILNIVHFELTYPTSLRFLEIYRYFLDLDDINYYRCCYLNEISLINYNLCSFSPSIIACTCLYLNLKSNILYFKGYNEEQLFNITGYKKPDVNHCLNKLIKAVEKIEEPENKFIAVKKKYSLEKYKKVSLDSFMIKEES